MLLLCSYYVVNAWLSTSYKKYKDQLDLFGSYLLSWYLCRNFCFRDITGYHRKMAKIHRQRVIREIFPYGEDGRI